MSTEVWFVVTLGLLIGFALGYLLARASLREECLGNFRIDRSDPEEGPYIFLELESRNGIDHISKLESVRFKVVNKNYIKD